MPSTPSDADLERLLRGANPAAMATVGVEGRPVVAAVWFALESDGRILVNMMESRVRLRHLKRDPRFALCVMDADDWYQSASLQLVADEISADLSLADIDALSMRYTGEPYGARNQARVSVRARIVHSSA